MRAIYILRGLFRGALSHRSFSMVFDWFYPQHFEIVRKCMQVYFNQDEILYLVLKLLSDLLDNSSNRMRFDTWNVNGLILYKETSNIVIKYLEFTRCLTSKQVKSDVHSEVYKFLSVMMLIVQRCLNGNFINFAICDFYKDNSFCHMSYLVFMSILKQNLKQIR